MNKTNILLLILAIFLTATLTGYALAADGDVNISTNETIANPVSTPIDTIVINEDANVINITENSNETTIAETIIKEEQKKSSPGFGIADTIISLIAVVAIVFVIARKNR